MRKSDEKGEKTGRMRKETFIKKGEIELDKSWRFFLMLEGLLAVYLLWQLMDNLPFLILLLVGVFLLLIAQKRKESAKTKNLQYILSWFLIVFSLLSLPAVWFMLILAVLFISLKGLEWSGLSTKQPLYHVKKQLLMIQTKEPLDHSGQLKKESLFGNRRIGTQVFEWDDINLLIGGGDTIIDLGNTLLPKRENYIVLRKGIGRTRILVPTGIGVHLDCNLFAGSVQISDEKIEMFNQRLSLYSNDFASSSRQIKIIASCLVGEIEVIYI